MNTPYYTDEQITLHLGDSLDVLPTMPDASVDAIVTDPPYGLEFMGRDWDAPWKTGNGFRRADNEADAGRDSVFGRASRTSPQYIAGCGYQEWCQAWAAQCLRVLKPGGHLLAFGAPRTYHRLAAGIEDAGFEVRDSIHWVYGSGFPKSLDVAKAIDKAGGQSPADLGVALRVARERAGLSRQQVAESLGCHPASVGDWEDGRARALGEAREVCTPSPAYRAKLAQLLGYTDDERLIVGEGGGTRGLYESGHRGVAYGAAATDGAKAWDGWGTALKPAHEPIIVARKPLAGTVAANVLEHGTGALNIDGCRLSHGEGSSPSVRRRAGKAPVREAGSWSNDRRSPASFHAEHAGEDLGRWPANLVLTHSPDCEQVGERLVRGDSRSGQDAGTRAGGFGNVGADSGGKRPNGVLHGSETVAVFRCEPGCPVAELDRRSGVLTSGANPTRRNSDKFRDAYGEFTGQAECVPARGADSGGASRFFPVFRYEAKAPASERPRLSDGTAHATVKPLDLMRWLVRLVTPPGGTVLDPFAGSGTTLEAAILEGFRAVGIERERSYADLCVARLSKPLQPTLFADPGDAA